MDKSKIQQYLKTKYFGQNLICLEETDSTNNECKRNTTLPNGTVYISEIQTAGKGRRGNSWTSEYGVGAWFSILLKTNLPADIISQTTLVAGLAICNAIGGKIKYPNDIVINGKKVCGILTEAVLNNENCIVCGIGININTKSFDENIKEKATSLFLENGYEFEREKIVADVLNEFEKQFEIFRINGFDGIIDEYKEKCITIGREIRVLYKSKEIIGKCTGISSNGNIIVNSNGTELEINSGEISVRGIYGYI